MCSGPLSEKEPLRKRRRRSFMSDRAARTPESSAQFEAAFAHISQDQLERARQDRRSPPLDTTTTYYFPCKICGSLEGKIDGHCAHGPCSSAFHWRCGVNRVWHKQNWYIYCSKDCADNDASNRS
jgi:hypothetical protein